MRNILKHLLLACLLLVTANITHASAGGFDHGIWHDLLQKHVHMIRQGQASQVDYKGFQRDRNALQTYLSRLSKVSMNDFADWDKSERLAFLINAYNAFTVELILTRYPELDSIKDLGSFLRSPWENKFIPLLGKKRSLDDIEHGMIRYPGNYNKPRIHFAVNCASIGCPALRNEAFIGKELDQQLEKVTKAFLEDRTRNRYNPSKKRLEVSKIFSWYKKDFESGWGGWHSLSDFFAHYADSLSDNAQYKQAISAGNVRISHLDYDWKLNDRK